MTQAALETLVYNYLASSQPITASGQHRPSMGAVIGEMYDAQSRADILAGVSAVLSLMAADKVLLFRSGTAYLADKSLFGTNDVKVATLVTSGSSITFDFASVPLLICDGPSFATPKTIAHSNEGNKVEFVFNVSSVAAILTLPSTYILNNGDYVAASHQWTPPYTGYFKLTSTKGLSKWAATIEGPLL